MTPKIFSNIKSRIESASELDGYEDLTPEDKEKVDKAWEAGEVAPEDIPESAKKAQGTGDEDDEEKKPKGRKAAAKASAGEEKPKRARATKKVTSLSFGRSSSLTMCVETCTGSGRR